MRAKSRRDGFVVRTRDDAACVLDLEGDACRIFTMAGLGEAPRWMAQRRGVCFVLAA
jgi:hypothetical protein